MQQLDFLFSILAIRSVFKLIYLPELYRFFLLLIVVGVGYNSTLSLGIVIASATV